MSDLHIKLGHVLGPRAVRVQWLLGLLAGGIADAVPHEVAPLLGESLRQSGSFLTTVGFWARRLGTFEAVEAVRDAEGTVIVGLRDARNRVWNLRCIVGESSPHPLEFYSIARPLPPGMRIRIGGDPDGEALAALERRCPIERGDGSRVTLVHGRSAFDRVRLAEWAGLWVAEDQGVPVASYGTAGHRARIGGRDLDLVYLFHTRVLPSHRRLGLMETLMAVLSEERFRRSIRADGLYVYVDPQNDVIREWSPATPWNARPFRALIGCEAVAGLPAGRVATAADALHIATLLNRTHAGEEMFLPTDPARITARLTRAPECYGFERLLITERAVVGVWQDGEERIHERAGTRQVSRRATVVDWGIASVSDLPALEMLLRAWCGYLTARGVTHVSIFGSDATPAAGLLRSLAESVVDIELRSTGVAEPVDSVARGVYVDPIYY